MTDSESEILPLDFEKEYAAEMMKVKEPRIPTWTEGMESPEEACEVCTERFRRFVRICVQWQILLNENVQTE